MCEIRLLFPVHMRTFFQTGTWQSGLEEIRVRVGQPIEFCYGSYNCYLTGREKEQMFCDEKDYRRWEKDLYHATEADLREMLNYISNYSLYACKEEIKQGYITIEGGHRVGVAGQTVLVDGKIAGISPIMFLNIRIAHEKCGCARKILPLIRQRDSIYNTLILSMPGAGKTTLLRDSIRALSNGEAYGIRLKVCVVDERSEIAASFHGVPQNDMGPRTDVMDGCGKAEGMQLLIRSMSPQIIAVDELGTESDFYAVEQALNCGSRVLGTIHAGNMKELSEKPYLKRWMERRLFQRFIFLEKEADGRRKMQVYDEHMERITC